MFRGAQKYCGQFQYMYTSTPQLNHKLDESLFVDINNLYLFRRRAAVFELNNPIKQSIQN